MRREPLGWSLGIALGAALAALLGGYIPSWGVALAPAAATAVFSVGAYRIPEDVALAWVLRVTVALTIGFVAVTAPLTLSRLAESPEAAIEAEEVLLVRGIDEVESRLRAMWIVMASMVPVGAIVLARRFRQQRSADEPRNPSDSE